MNEYIELTFSNITIGQGEILTAELSGIGFEGFEENDGHLKAFIRQEDFDETATDEISNRHSLHPQKIVLPETNWNALWESNFTPVVVNDFVAVRADFHEQINGVMHEIIITPKMSFGTGHHATTWMMMKNMQDLDFNGKSVFDFGTGTGILAILAEKLGAAQIEAIDNDEWSITNAAENRTKNHAERISFHQSDAPAIGVQFDVILANINKNILLGNMSLLRSGLKPGGTLLMSGLLPGDAAEILLAAGQRGLSLVSREEKDNWLLLRLSY